MKTKGLATIALAIVATMILLYLVTNGYTKHHTAGFANGNYTLTAYTVDWCPHCQTFKPELKKLAPQQTVNEKIVNIVSVDPEKDPSKKNSAVKGYPTIILTNPDGTTKEYSGGRTATAIQSWLSTVVSPS